LKRKGLGGGIDLDKRQAFGIIDIQKPVF